MMPAIARDAMMKWTHRAGTSPSSIAFTNSFRSTGSRFASWASASFPAIRNSGWKSGCGGESGGYESALRGAYRAHAYVHWLRQLSEPRVCRARQTRCEFCRFSPPQPDFQRSLRAEGAQTAVPRDGAAHRPARRSAPRKEETRLRVPWIPAYAGMTQGCRDDTRVPG